MKALISAKEGVYYWRVMKDGTEVPDYSGTKKEKIEQVGKRNKDKRTEATLKVLVMRAEGASARKISEATGFHSAYVRTDESHRAGLEGTARKRFSQ